MLSLVLCLISFTFNMLFAEPSRFQLVCAYLLNIFFASITLGEMWKQYRIEKAFENAKSPSKEQLQFLNKMYEMMIKKNQEIIDKIQIDNGNSKQ